MKENKMNKKIDNNKLNTNLFTKEIFETIEELKIEKNCNTCIHNISSDETMNCGEYVQHCNKNHWDTCNPYESDTNIWNNCKDYEKKNKEIDSNKLNTKEINKLKFEIIEMLNKYNDKQILQIGIGKENNIDVSLYADPKYTDEQMYEIRLGLEDNLDISTYTNPNFNKEQMFEIREGLKEGIDVSSYADPKFNSPQMYQIRKVLSYNLNKGKL